MSIANRIDVGAIGRRILHPAILLNVVAPLAAYQTVWTMRQRRETVPFRSAAATP